METCEQQVTWMEERARSCGRGRARKLATRRRRRASTAPRRKAMVEKSAIDAAPFAFQERVERIDWRSVSFIDFDRLIRHVDIDTLEAVLDTVVFGDIQGEDTRNFTEANFIRIFRLAQLMVEYLLHVQELLTHHKSELLESRSSLQQRNEKMRSRFLWQRDALLHTRHELKQAKKTLQTYEVMLKIQGKNQVIQASCQSNIQRQGRHCRFCEKVFESSYYLDLHVVRKHQQKHGVTEDKLLAMVSKAEEATAAKVRTLQKDLRRSDNRVHDVQTRLEVLQAQILSNNTRVGNLHAVEKSQGKDHDGPNQERLCELESKFSVLEHQVKALGQENSRLLEDLNMANTKVVDLHFAKRQSVFALETQVDDLQKENQQLKRAITKVHNTSNLEASNQSPENPTNMDPVRILTSRPKIFQPEAPKIKSSATSSFQIHKLPEPILAIIEAKEPAIHDTTTDLGLDDEELLPDARERWTMEPDEDEALLALARPSSRMEERSVPIEECKSREDESPIIAEEMRAKLETQMKAAHEEQIRRQKAVRRLLFKELVKEKSETKRKGKQAKSEDHTRNSKPGSQYSQTPKSETPHGSIAPLLLLLRNKEDTSSPSSSTARTIVRKQPKCILRPLKPTVLPPKMSLHNSNPNSKLTQINKPSKEHIIERLGAVTRELGKYFPPKTNVVEKAQSVRKPETETTERQEVARDHVGEVTSKYPACEGKANEFDEELQKFGVTSITNGISDTTYNSVSSTLKMQRSLRIMSQRAICDRDTEIIESQFSESGSDANGSETSEINLISSNRNQVFSRDKYLKASGKELYFSPRSDESEHQHVSRNQNLPPSRGEVIESTVAEFVDNSWQLELDKEVEEEDFGIGDWESDDGAR